MVLIYPYWNVNEGGWTTQWEDGAVLIYPYWNVNAVRGSVRARRFRF